MKKLSYAQTVCVRKAGLALQRSQSLWPGCRVGVAVSGGVDSFVLLKTLKIRQSVVPFKFEIMALHINPGFDRANHAALLPWLATEGIAGHIELATHGPDAHSEINRKKSACFYCAMQRRKRLFLLAARYNLTHLTFGHNADDLLTTFLLNFWRTGRIKGMDASVSFFGGKLFVERPLLFVEKKYIRQAAAQWKLPIWSNPCPSAGKTDRKLVDDLAAKINESIPGARQSMISALIRSEMENAERAATLPKEKRKFNPDRATKPTETSAKSD